MAAVPRDSRIDATYALWRMGYRFVAATCRRLRTDVFETRLFGKRTVCCIGADAARMVYDQRLFEREQALPGRVQDTLTGRGGVQSLDGEQHRHRKRTFMLLLSREHATELAAATAEEWRSAAERWEKRARVVLFDESLEVLCRAVCRYAGVPLPPRDVVRRTRDFAAMIEGSARIGPEHWAARRARRRAERWGAHLIESWRHRAEHAAGGGIARTVALHRDAEGHLLDTKIAAIELLNVLRPTVAIAYFVAFAAHALEQHPLCRQRLLTGGDAEVECFVNEVRRFYPLFPFVAARARERFVWRGYSFPRGMRVLLDLYATDHDPRLWRSPEEFQPQRFDRYADDGFRLVAQGAGDPHTGHRCAGERVTIEVLKTAVAFLVRELRYRVPAQDQHIDLARMPTLPASRMVLASVALRREPEARGRSFRTA